MLYSRGVDAAGSQVGRSFNRAAATRRRGLVCPDAFSPDQLLYAFSVSLLSLPGRFADSDVARRGANARRRAPARRRCVSGRAGRAALAAEQAGSRAFWGELHRDVC